MGLHLLFMVGELGAEERASIQTQALIYWYNKVDTNNIPAPIK